MVRAIYGGSFNPIHFGHLGLAAWVVEHTDVDELWLMVTPNNPLKDCHILAPQEERLKAAKEAVEREGLQHVVVSDFEFALPVPSYTAQTLRALTAEYPTDEWVLVIGEDNWRLFAQWRDWQWILQEFRVFVYPRHGVGQVEDVSSLDSLPEAVDRADVKGVRFLTDAPYFDISSTQLRANR